MTDPAGPAPYGTQLGGSLVWFAIGMIVTGVVGAITVLTFIDERIEKRVEEALAARPAAPAASGAALPSGAVVAFDAPTRCPEGWSEFADAQSRVIVGAAFGTGFSPRLGDDPDGGALAEYKYREHGGWERVRLTTAHLPAHEHKVAQAGADTAVDIPGMVSGTAAAVRTAIGGDTTTPIGGDQPHPNMPPFLALYICKKD